MTGRAAVTGGEKPICPGIGVRRSDGNHMILGVSCALSKAEAHWRKVSAKLADWMEANLPEGFSVFALPEHQRRRLRTSNMAERIHQEIKRRTRVAGLFPNEASVLRLVTAIHIEISEDWETGRAYLAI